MEQHIENLLRCGPRIINSYQLVEKSTIGDKVSLVVQIVIPHYVTQIHEEYMEWVGNVLPLYDNAGTFELLNHKYEGAFCYLTLKYIGRRRLSGN